MQCRLTRSRSPSTPYWTHLDSVPAGSTTPVDIRSLTYDGGAWRVDDGVRLSLDTSTGQESAYVKDPGVSVHPAGQAGGYVMIYVTAIP